MYMYKNRSGFHVKKLAAQLQATINHSLCCMTTDDVSHRSTELRVRVKEGGWRYAGKANT